MGFIMAVKMLLWAHQLAKVLQHEQKKILDFFTNGKPKYSFGK